jgi:hypothetical protein
MAAVGIRCLLIDDRPWPGESVPEPRSFSIRHVGLRPACGPPADKLRVFPDVYQDQQRSILKMTVFK